MSEQIQTDNTSIATASDRDDDWNIVSQDWKDDATDAGSTTDDAVEKEHNAEDGATAEDDAGTESVKEDAIEVEVEVEVEEPESSPVNSAAKRIKTYVIDRAASLKELNLIQSVLLRIIIGMGVMCYGYYFVKDSYYSYRINNMVGSIDSLPLEPKYLNMHMKKCNDMFAYYSEVLNTCVESTTDDKHCLNSYYKLVTKSSEFCNWNPDELYNQNYLHIIVKQTSDNVNSFFSSIGDYLVQGGSKQYETLKGLNADLQPKLYDIFERSVSGVLATEKQISKFIAKSIEENEVGDKVESLINKGNEVLADAGDQLLKGSNIAYDATKKVAADAIDIAGEYINKENLVKAQNKAASVYKGFYADLLGL